MIPVPESHQHAASFTAQRFESTAVAGDDKMQSHVRASYELPAEELHSPNAGLHVDSPAGVDQARDKSRV